MNVTDLEAMLEPVVAALAPTSFGRPKTQAVIKRHLEVFLSMRAHGLTLRAIADGLNVRGARTKKGAEFTAASLGRMIERAVDRSRREAPARTRTDSGARPANASGRKESPLENSVLAVFTERINQVMAQRATDEILTRGRRR
jgi:hypothetical protein